MLAELHEESRRKLTAQVDLVVVVRRVWLSRFVFTGDKEAGTRLAAHFVAERGRVRQASRDDIAWAHLSASDRHLVGSVQAQLVQGTEDVDELVTKPVLERHALGVNPARDQQHLFVLDVDALDFADALGEVENLWLRKRWSRKPALVLLEDHGRVQALLNLRRTGKNNLKPASGLRRINAVRPPATDTRC